MEQSPATDISHTHPYTCNSCSVAFRNGEAQRTHMRSDWHRYNLKRRMAELPPYFSGRLQREVLPRRRGLMRRQRRLALSKSVRYVRKPISARMRTETTWAVQKHKLRVAAGSRKGSVNGSVAPSSYRFHYQWWRCYQRAHWRPRTLKQSSRR